MEQTDKPRIMDVAGAAAQLLCSKWTVYSLCQSGQLRSVRVGRLLRIPQSAIDDFINGNEAPHRLGGGSGASEKQLVSIGKHTTTSTS
jgi:excisionase family DNA binding protein